MNESTPVGYGRQTGFLLLMFLIMLLFKASVFGQVDFSEPYVISDSFIPRTPSSIIVADVNRDFIPDIVANNYRYPNGPLIWYESVFTGNNNFMPHLIEDDRTYPGLSVDVADLDNDGDRDIIASFDSDVVLAWYENFPAIDIFSPAQAISQQDIFPNAVKAIDMDRDLDLDVLILTVYGELQWFENTDGKGTFSEANNLNEENPNIAGAICLSDLDGDDDDDLVIFERNKTVWYELRNDTAAFSSEKLISDSITGIYTGTVADFDNDDDFDILAAGLNNIVIFMNSDARGNFSDPIVITQSAGEVRSVCASDINNDGLVDVLTATINGEIRWYANVDGNRFASSKLIYKSYNRAGIVAAGDFDSDGDNDVISAYEADTKGLLLHKNLLVETDVHEKEMVPETFRLYQNYPNPFSARGGSGSDGNPTTTIEYTLHTPASVIPSRGGNIRGALVELKVYDILGREVTILLNEKQKPGKYSVSFDGTDLPSGVYFYRLIVGQSWQSKKMTLIK